MLLGSYTHSGAYVCCITQVMDPSRFTALRCFWRYCSTANRCPAAVKTKPRGSSHSPRKHFSYNTSIFRYLSLVVRTVIGGATLALWCLEALRAVRSLLSQSKMLDLILSSRTKLLLCGFGVFV